MVLCYQMEVYQCYNNHLRCTKRHPSVYEHCWGISEHCKLVLHIAGTSAPSDSHLFGDPMPCHFCSLSTIKMIQNHVGCHGIYRLLLLLLLLIVIIFFVVTYLLVVWTRCKLLQWCIIYACCCYCCCSSLWAPAGLDVGVRYFTRHRDTKSNTTTIYDGVVHAMSTSRAPAESNPATNPRCTLPTTTTTTVNYRYAPTVVLLGRTSVYNYSCSIGSCGDTTNNNNNTHTR